MKKILTLTVFVLLSALGLQAQTLEELKAKKAELETAQAAEQAKADAYNAELGSLASEIEILSGWQKGFDGSIGFALNNSFNWVSSPNRDGKSTGINIGATAYANRIADKYFWRNKGFITKAWQDQDLTDNDDDKLFDKHNGTIDILNVSSLFGYKLSDKIAISSLAEINTSVENFFEPGTFDFGVGATWTPAKDFIVVIHPFNYHIAFPGEASKANGLETTGSIGAKIRVDYTKSLYIAGKKVAWSSTLTTFFPYKEKDPTLFEFSWLNNLSLEVWKGIGVGVGFGLRNAEFEDPDLQGYLNLGLSYGF